MILATFSKVASSILQLISGILQFSIWGGIVSTFLLILSNLTIVSPVHFPKKMSYDWKDRFSFQHNLGEKYSACSHFIDGETQSAGMWKDLHPAVITACSCVLCVIH